MMARRSSNNNGDNDDEHERTSLLASSSAPPPPTSTLPPFRARSSSGGSGTRTTTTLTDAALVAITSKARRLADDDKEEEGDDDDDLGDDESFDEDIEGADYLEYISARAAAFNESFDASTRSTPPIANITTTTSTTTNATAAAGSAWQVPRNEVEKEEARQQRRRRTTMLSLPRPLSHPEIEPSRDGTTPSKTLSSPHWLLQPLTVRLAGILLFVLFLGAALLLALGAYIAGPPQRPTGKYILLESQMISSSMGGGSSSSADDFLKYYDFYAGKDSAGSGGYITYVSREVAEADGIVGVVTESVPASNMIEIYEEGDPRGVEIDWLKEDLVFLEQLKRRREMMEDEKEKDEASYIVGGVVSADDHNNIEITENHDTVGIQNLPPPRLEPFNPDSTNATNPTETFIILGSKATPDGPRNSIRLEGRRRFNRGLFIVDLRHMPSGCGTWPALWLTDEANWPVNGEIDIIEGVNYQDTAKTALHTAKECKMDDVPELTKTGSWDTAVGIPDRKTGKPDMTFRYAQNCFVYDPHQWINQGCVATDVKLEGRSLGIPLNENGGGVYALEWDPVYHHIRTWVFSPHGRVPRNLRDALRSANNVDIETRVAPDTSLWGLPYGHFPIGKMCSDEDDRCGCVKQIEHLNLNFIYFHITRRRNQLSC
jgi:hypothetical protein